MPAFARRAAGPLSHVASMLDIGAVGNGPPLATLALPSNSAMSGSVHLPARLA
jgi:hypothetical protein